MKENNTSQMANLHVEIAYEDHEKLKKIARNSKGLYSKSVLVRKAISEFIERIYKI